MKSETIVRLLDEIKQLVFGDIMLCRQTVKMVP